MNIYLFGWFGFKNVGDDILLAKMLEFFSLRDNMHVEVPVSDGGNGYLGALFSDYPFARPVRRSYLKMFLAARRNSCLVIGPGGLFPQQNIAKVFVFFMLALWWKAFGKAVVFFCIGGNKNQDRVSSFLWRRIVDIADLFISRDQNLFDGAGIGERESVFIAADAIFATDPLDSSLQEYNECARSVAFAFANLFDGDSYGDDYQDYLEACVKVVEHACQLGFSIDLLSFTAGSDERLNMDIARCVSQARAMNYEQSFSAVENLRSYSLVVGMRFHAVVLSILSFVPVVPIAYADKTEDLARQCGLTNLLVYYCRNDSEYFYRFIPLDGDAVNMRIDAVLNNPGLGLPNSNVLLEYKQRADGSFKRLSCLLDTIAAKKCVDSQVQEKLP